MSGWPRQQFPTTSGGCAPPTLAKKRGRRGPSPRPFQHGATVKDGPVALALPGARRRSGDDTSWGRRWLCSQQRGEWRPFSSGSHCVWKGAGPRWITALQPFSPKLQFLSDKLSLGGYHPSFPFQSSGSVDYSDSFCQLFIVFFFFFFMEERVFRGLYSAMFMDIHGSLLLEVTTNPVWPRGAQPTQPRTSCVRGQRDW